MTSDELRRLLAKNPSLSVGDSRPVAKLESNLGYAPLGAEKIQGRAGGKFLIRVESVRSRLLDQDNLCEKYHVDLCRYAGVVPYDSPEQTKITVSQRKAEKGESEKVIVEVFEI